MRANDGFFIPEILEKAKESLKRDDEFIEAVRKYAENDAVNC